MAKKKKKKKKAKKPAKEKPEQPQVTPHPTAGRKITEFEDQLDKQLASETESAGRGPGRPPKEPPPESKTVDLNIIKPVISMPFDLWAQKVDVPQLKLTSKEADLLAGPVKELLDYYMPQIPVIAWAWISLSVASYSVMKTRLELIAELKKQKSAASDTDKVKSPGQGGPTSPVGVTMPTQQEIKTVKIQ